ncbi:MAG: hypothetical protein HQ511_02810 [Rhodospirillales bacterium]|nr:hypothetical protein [Rhodospirillales bacterium]
MTRKTSTFMIDRRWVRVALLLPFVLVVLGAKWPPIDHTAPVDRVRELSSSLQLELAPVPSFRFSQDLVASGGPPGEPGHIRLEGTGSGTAEEGNLSWTIRLERIVIDGAEFSGDPLVDVSIVTQRSGRTLGMWANLRGLPQKQDRGSVGWMARRLGTQWLNTLTEDPFGLPAGPVQQGAPFVSLGRYLANGLGGIDGLRATEPLGPSRVDGVATYNGRQVVAGHLSDGFSLEANVGSARVHAAGYALVDVETGLTLDSLVHFTGNLRVAKVRRTFDLQIHSRIDLE